MLERFTPVAKQIQVKTPLECTAQDVKDPVKIEDGLTVKPTNEVGISHKWRCDSLKKISDDALTLKNAHHKFVGGETCKAEKLIKTVNDNRLISVITNDTKSDDDTTLVCR